MAGLLTEKQRRAYFLREDFPDMSRQQAASYLKISVRAYSRLCRDAAASIDLLVQMVISAGGDPRKVKDYLRAQIVHNGRSAA